jgi:putative phage-type endonuclease
MEQLSQEWFEARLGKVTASRVSDVLSTIKSGESATRRNYKLQLLTERLTKKKTESYMNQAMQDGIDREPIAREIYEHLKDVKVEETGFVQHPAIEMAGASPDGLVGDDGIIEIKCPIETTHTTNLLEKKLPSKYKPQVQFQLAATGRDWCDFISYNPNFEPKHQLVVVRVERDNDYIEKIEFEILKFLAEIELLIKQLEEI